MSPIVKIFKNFSGNSRNKRAKIFRESFSINQDTKILDLGSEDGENISSILNETDANPKNVYIADIEANAVQEGNRNFGYHAVLIGESGKLPFPDKFFDVVFCSSVIEHTTVAKAEVWNWKSGRRFREAAFSRQKMFADEIVRLGRQYFVQTPCKTFPIESHSWLPLVGYFPRELLVSTLKLSNRFWVKQTPPDFNLLGKADMQKLFPEAKIICEKKYGLTKSVMALKTDELH